MDRDTFITTVYCLVVEYYAMVKGTYPIRHGGFAPALTDAEVITMETGESGHLAVERRA